MWRSPSILATIAGLTVGFLGIEVWPPLLMSIENTDDALKSTVERLRYEHWEDESFSDEVADALIRFVTDKASSNAETLAYMLRGFFEGLRRHIAFERDHIVPLLCKRTRAQH